MDSVLRAFVVYLVVLLLFRIAGRRTLAQATPFDLVLILMISQSTQQALLGADYSVVNGLLVVASLLFAEITMNRLKRRSRRLGRLLDGVPAILVENGRTIPQNMIWAQVQEEDIMEAARRLRGLERMDQIHYAIFEVTGQITVIPRHEEMG